jgi:hypothetical protein
LRSRDVGVKQAVIADLRYMSPHGGTSPKNIVPIHG